MVPCTGTICRFEEGEAVSKLNAPKKLNVTLKDPAFVDGCPAGIKAEILRKRAVQDACDALAQDILDLMSRSAGEAHRLHIDARIEMREIRRERI
jgi:hypothetical protein